MHVCNSKTNSGQEVKSEQQAQDKERKADSYLKWCSHFLKMAYPSKCLPACLLWQFKAITSLYHIGCLNIKCKKISWFSFNSKAILKVQEKLQRYKEETEQKYKINDTFEKYVISSISISSPRLVDCVHMSSGILFMIHSHLITKGPCKRTTFLYKV